MWPFRRKKLPPSGTPLTMQELAEMLSDPASLRASLEDLRKNASCPNCSSKNVKPILYGIIPPGEADKYSDHHLGGFAPDMPRQMHCVECSHEWNLT